MNRVKVKHGRVEATVEVEAEGDRKRARIVAVARKDGTQVTDALDSDAVSEICSAAIAHVEMQARRKGKEPKA